jgi:hypothetical protein
MAQHNEVAEENDPKIIIVDDSVYSIMFVSPSVTVIICCCILASVSWNLDQVANNLIPFRELFTTNLTFVDLNIKNTLVHPVVLPVHHQQRHTMHQLITTSANQLHQRSLGVRN